MTFMEWNAFSKYLYIGILGKGSDYSSLCDIKISPHSQFASMGRKQFNLHSLHQGIVIVQVTHSVEKHMNCKENQGHFKPSLATFYPFELVSDFSYLSINFYLCKR